MPRCHHAPRWLPPGGAALWATLLAVASACTAGPAGPGRVADVTGAYLLEAIDGAPVPENGAMSLDLHPEIGETLPLYGWRAGLTAAGAGEDDFGRWALGAGGTRVRFHSQRGLAPYESPIARGAGGAGVRVEVRGRGGRVYTFRRVRPFDGPQGSLRVSVVDGAAARVAGARLLFRAPDGLTEPAASSEGAPYTTSGPPGEWTVAITPPSGYALAAGQTNPARATVVVNQTVTVQVTLARSGGD